MNLSVIAPVQESAASEDSSAAEEAEEDKEDDEDKEDVAVELVEVKKELFLPADPSDMTVNINE